MLLAALLVSTLATQAAGPPPNLVLFENGRIDGKEAWNARRAVLRDRLLAYEYGSIPPPPAEVRAEVIEQRTLFDGAAVMRHVRLVWDEAPGFAMEAGIILPAGPGPHPVIVDIDPVWHDHNRDRARRTVEAGYAFAGIRYHDADPDTGARDTGVYPHYPGYGWGSVAAWAWAASRLIDHLATLPEIDQAAIAVTGHSRCGKAAILAGALDERIGLVAPHCSGAGGAALYNVQNAKAETLALITDPERFHYWFSPNIRTYAGREADLPVDQHFLHALIAPRAFLSMEAFGDPWANPLGALTACIWALPVYEAFDAGDKLTYLIRPGGHDPTAEGWAALLAYADHVFRGAAKPAVGEGWRLASGAALHEPIAGLREEPEWILWFDDGYGPEAVTVPPHRAFWSDGGYYTALKSVTPRHIGSLMAADDASAAARVAPGNLAVTALGAWGSYEVFDYSAKGCKHKSIVLRDAGGRYAILYSQFAMSGAGIETMPVFIDAAGQSVLAYAAPIAGPGNLRAEHYFVIEPESDRPKRIDLAPIRAALGKALPDGGALRTGDGLDLANLRYETPVYRSGDPNERPTGGAIVLKLALDGAALRVLDAEYRPAN